MYIYTPAYSFGSGFFHKAIHLFVFLTFLLLAPIVKIIISKSLGTGLLLTQEVAVKKFLDQDFSGAALAEFRREVRNF